VAITLTSRGLDLETSMSILYRARRRCLDRGNNVIHVAAVSRFCFWVQRVPGRLAQLVPPKQEAAKSAMSVLVQPAAASKLISSVSCTTKLSS
jgi:hypothetical protein